MDNKVKITARCGAANLLWDAMLQTGGEDLWETFGVELGFKELVVDVKVTVNGVEVPFLDTVREFLSRYHAHVKSEAKHMVRKGVLDIHLDAVEEALSSLAEKIRDADKDIIEKLNKTLERD